MYLEVRQGRASVDLGPRWSVEAVHFLFRVLQDTHGHSIDCTPIHPLAEDPVVISKSRPHMLHRGAPAVFSKPFHVSPCGGPWPRVRTLWTPWPRVLNRLRRPLDLPTSRARVPPRRPAVKPAVQIFVAASVGALSIRSWSGRIVVRSSSEPSAPSLTAPETPTDSLMKHTMQTHGTSRASRLRRSAFAWNSSRRRPS